MAGKRTGERPFEVTGRELFTILLRHSDDVSFVSYVQFLITKLRLTKNKRDQKFKFVVRLFYISRKEI